MVSREMMASGWWWWWWFRVFSSLADTSSHAFMCCVHAFSTYVIMSVFSVLARKEINVILGFDFY